MGNCLGTPPKPKKTKKWAWRQNVGKTGSKQATGAGNGSANGNVTVGGTSGVAAAGGKDTGDSVALTKDASEPIVVGISSDTPVGNTNKEPIDACNTAKSLDIVAKNLDLVVKRIDMLAKSTESVKSPELVANSHDLVAKSLDLAAKSPNLVANIPDLISKSPDLVANIPDLMVAVSTSRASSKIDQSSNSNDSYGNIFKLALDELDARDKAAGQDANISSIAVGTEDFLLGKELGVGSFGTVWEATDKKSGKSVAVKELNGALWTAKTAKRAYQEAYYMWQFGCHENILGLHGVYETPSGSVWLVLEQMDTDLYRMIESGILSDTDKRYITYQICSAVLFLHSANIIHRDFKPENVLWNSNNTVKLCDFGMARSLSAVGMGDVAVTEQVLTAGTGTLWHAAPEIIMEATSYTKAVDIWSVGSTLVELLSGSILANGKDKFQQLTMILICLPVATVDDIESLKSPFSARIAALATDTIGIDRNQFGLDSVMAGVPADAVELCRSMLWLNPNKRCTIEEALAHPYVAVHRDPAREIIMSDELVPPLSDWKIHGIDEYRAQVSEIMKNMHADKRSQ